MSDYKKMFKNLLFFTESDKTEDFILKETKQENIMVISDSKSEGKRTDRKDKAGALNKSDSHESEKKEKQDLDKKEKIEVKKEISKKLSENMEYLKKVYTIPVNGDAVIREFKVVVKNKIVSAFMIFFDGMVDRKVIDDDILRSLMLSSNMNIKDDDETIAEFVRNRLLTHNQIKEIQEYSKIIDEINFGGCGIFIDGMDSAFAADVKGWEHRGIERPNTELVIRGPQEGFGELLRVNTALVRKILKDKDLIVENAQVGIRSKTPCSILYIKDIANDSLVKEVKRRVKSIKTDYIIDSGELEQFIEDSSIFPVPQMIATERPDRVASGLAKGKVAIILHGSPFALVVPAAMHELIQSPEDKYVRAPYANLLRGVRIIAIIMSLLLPAIYLAITNFHQEMIPTDLLIAIEATREKVPFPGIIEILIMEFSFELIREAGIRIPGPIGPTLGIIGALILGQAAVAANIVSPILIIIVALTGIGSFAVPNFSAGFAFRILRFGYILLAAMSGFLGITTGLFLQGVWFANSKSFGIPFLAPFGPKTKGGLSDEILVAPAWNQENRPDFLNTKNSTSQPDISRGWKEKRKEDKKNSEE